MVGRLLPDIGIGIGIGIGRLFPDIGIGGSLVGSSSLLTVVASGTVLVSTGVVASSIVFC
jgi:hypothetical protein